MAEQIKIMLHALDQLEQHGFAFPERRITVLTSENRVAIGDRIVLLLGGAVVARALLEHPYYNQGQWIGQRSNCVG